MEGGEELGKVEGFVCLFVCGGVLAVLGRWMFVCGCTLSSIVSLYFKSSLNPELAPVG